MNEKLVYFTLTVLLLVAILQPWAIWRLAILRIKHKKTIREEQKMRGSPLGPEELELASVYRVIGSYFDSGVGHLLILKNISPLAGVKSDVKLFLLTKLDVFDKEGIPLPTKLIGDRKYGVRQINPDGKVTFFLVS